MDRASSRGVKSCPQAHKCRGYMFSGPGLGLVNRFYGSVILVSSRAVNRLTDTSINWLKYGFWTKL